MPPDFSTEPFLLRVQAEAHNRGGRLDPVAMTEQGGYGRGALSGHIGGRPLRILLLGEEPLPPPEPPPAAAGAGQPALAIVLDDAGHSPADGEVVAALPPEVAVAVLANAPFATEVAQALHRQGREVLLHLPMEPTPGGGVGPGEGAIEVGLPAAEVRRRVVAALAAVPGARGVNNHMGSRATADEDTMAAVVGALVGAGLYVLDSRTTHQSVLGAAARRAGLPALRRDVFLDVVAEEAAIRHALREAVELAQARGHAVAVGHLHPLTVRVLEEERHGLLGEVQLVRPSQLAR